MAFLCYFSWQECLQWHRRHCDTTLARASLQATTTGQILTPLQFFEWAKENIEGIKFFFVNNNDVEEHPISQSVQFAGACTIPGTRSHHRFIPISTNAVRMSRISADNAEIGTLATVSPNVSEKMGENTELAETFTNPSQIKCQPGQYVACAYDGHWYLGNGVKCEDECGDVLVSFMHPKGPSKSFQWPTRSDQCLIPVTHILCIVDPPSTSTGRFYHITQDASSTIKARFGIFKLQNKQ